MLETPEPCPLVGSIQEVSNHISGSISTIPSSHRPECKPHYSGLLASLEKKCTCHDEQCLRELEVVREQLSQILDSKPCEPLAKIDLGNGQLKALLDRIFDTLPVKGPIDQKPCGLSGEFHFFCPACFAKRNRFSDMRTHLRDDHGLDEKTLNDLFPQGITTKYIRCFGKFDIAQARDNRFVKNPHTTPRMRRTASANRTEAPDHAMSGTLSKRDGGSSRKRPRTSSRPTRNTSVVKISLDVTEEEQPIHRQSSPVAIPRSPDSNSSITGVGKQFLYDPFLSNAYPPTSLVDDNNGLSGGQLGTNILFSGNMQNLNDLRTLETQNIFSNPQDTMFPLGDPESANLPCWSVAADDFISSPEISSYVHVYPDPDPDPEHPDTPDKKVKTRKMKREIGL
ncbi:hypothetical protein H2198_001821 [Neophaeococcomyces mojaviensis]|uniref:Uncharacterized protein n=1 Tax=Neophaeococcomyces mojaviensis TaxID=3383035 RepID=A0ACC3AFW2_9EURO|nr:hypothetical protein H2198_001821 [Knufia sp. JES_112]